MFLDELTSTVVKAKDIAHQAEVLVYQLKTLMDAKPESDFVKIEIENELAMATGSRREYLFRLLSEDFSERFGFEKTE